MTYHLEASNRSYLGFKRLILTACISILILTFFTSFNANARSTYNNTINLESAEGLVDEGYFIKPSTNGKFSREIENNHDGLDLHDKPGSEILAAADGKVFYKNKSISDAAGYGYYVMIEHNIKGRKIYTLYAHLQKRVTLAVNSGVKQGDVLGYMGSTGNSTGNHLHFTIISKLVRDVRQNPNPTCQKKFGKYASTCISSVSSPINILEHKFDPSPKNKIEFKALTDVESDYIFLDEINKTYQKGYLSDNLGINGQFRPTQNATTIETLRMIDKSILKETNDNSCNKNKLTNLEKADEKIGLKFSCLGILNNIDQIDAKSEITYAELSEIIINSMKQNTTLKQNTSSNFSNQSFSDLNSSNPYYSSIMTMIELNLIKGYSDGTFKPEEKVTRGHLAAIISKIEELK